MIIIIKSLSIWLVEIDNHYQFGWWRKIVKMKGQRKWQ
ncbi:hypothetical protein LTSEBAI_0531 [Salmonella enterica subsp. enterica serovar Baildon str. R6-199]|nr:hypothetical protein LTSEBAI_0531 [Salmonella enterica subsp. enterica serovar Baildon str. R6-199]